MSDDNPVDPGSDGSDGGDDRQYEVGYGKPPKHTRFRKGQSGNPKGRRKGVANFRTDVAEVLQTPVKLRQNGKIMKRSTQMAFLMKLREEALQGSSRSLELLLRFAALYNDRPDEASNEKMSEGDQAILDDFLARSGQGSPGVASSSTGGSNDDEGKS